MSSADESLRPRVAGFRTKLLVAIMLLVTLLTLLALYLAQSSLAENFEEDLQREFQGELAAIDRTQELRRVALVERCRGLVRRPRIRAAFEDDALDLLYPNAADELRDLVGRLDQPRPPGPPPALNAQFYRFLDRNGKVIRPPAGSERAVGILTPGEESRLALPGLSEGPQIGYLVREGKGESPALSEIIAMPIISLDTGELLAALVLGFEPPEFVGRDTHAGMKRGIWQDGRLFGPDFPAAAALRLAGNVDRAAAAPVRVALAGVPHLLFSNRLNPGSGYPPAFEACVYPLLDLEARQRRLRWQVLSAGTLLLLLGLAGSHVVSARLSAPVERLAQDSEVDRARRAQAEAALEMTSAELQRSARFSADASHQLKTPVTVLRAGLEELLAQDNLTPEECAEVSALIHQTYRLSSLIEDLLLLSRLDAGRLKLEFVPVNLSALIEASLDDLGALPEDFGLEVENDFPPDLWIVGEKRYTAIILQNLLENARKYNRQGGRIRVVARIEAGWVRLTVGNTGRSIPVAAQAHIFERFHRGAIGENVPGYGLGLNLARELARLHQGELRLIGSDADWTEFEVSFRLADPVSRSAPPA
ncbi:MAG: HAMP domain-containing histidine kinase [Opitutaceae bacterium]|nr:HAMP domain-containing histidine kinase [Opitutaceae bacterium]